MAELTPGSPEWARRVSPSKAAAILGISPWDSQRSMWHKMRGEAPWDAESEAMERGTICEPAVLAWWRKHHEHTDWREQVTMTIGDWCVATPDAICEHDDETVMVEAKTAANMDGWGDPGTDAIPTYYLTQVYVAMEVAHRNGVTVARAHIPVLGGYRLLFSNYVVEYDAAIGADLMERLEAWSASLAADEPPPLDDSVATYEAIRKLHPDIDRGAEVELTYTEALAFADAIHDDEHTTAHARLMRSTVLERMGRAQFAKHNGIKVARRQPRGDAVTFVPLAKNPQDIPEPIQETAS